MIVTRISSARVVVGSLPSIVVSKSGWPVVAAKCRLGACPCVGQAGRRVRRADRSRDSGSAGWDSPRARLEGDLVVNKVCLACERAALPFIVTPVR